MICQIVTENIFMLEDDTELKGKYVGQMPGYVGKDFTLNTCQEPKVKTTEVKDYVDGEFYFNMNDESWSYEMAIDFFANSTEKKIPAGKYTFSTDNTPGTFGSKSYCDLYTPNLGNCRFAEGSTVDVSYSGDNIIMDFNLILDGKDYILTMKYEGPITYDF